MRRVSDLLVDAQRVGVVASDSQGIALADGENRIRMVLTRRDEWVARGSDIVTKATLYYSGDSGVTWREVGHGAGPGGQKFHFRTGDLLTESALDLGVPITSDKGERRVRVELDCKEGLRTAVHLDIYAKPEPDRRTGHRSVGFISALDGQATGLNTISVSATPTGINRYMVVGIGLADETPATITTLLFNTTESVATENADTAAFATYYKQFARTLIAPSATTANVVLVLSVVADELTMGVMVFDDVHQTTPLENASTTTGTAASFTRTIATTSNDLVVGLLLVGGVPSTITSTAGTERFREAHADTYIVLLGATVNHASSGVITWTKTGNEPYRIWAASINATDVAGGSILRQMMQHAA